MIATHLPYPPSVNEYWLYAQGRVYISPQGREYSRRVGRLLAGIPRSTGRLRVAIVTHQPDRRVRDLDNILKCLLDSLTRAGAWDSDGQIDELAIIRGEPVREGTVEVIVSEIG